MLNPSLSLRRFFLAALCSLAACGDGGGTNPDPDPVPASLQKVAGDGQTGAVGSVLADSLAVRVLDSHGKGVPGVEVSFVSFAGTPTAGDVRTNAQGFSKTALTLPGRPGTDSVFATVAGLATVRFTVTVVPGPPATIHRMEGEDQFASAGQPLQVAPLVRVEDAYGNLVPGVLVTFTPSAGSGVAAPATVTTDSMGRARTGYWILGREGTNRLVVNAGTVSTEYTATGYGVCTQTPYTLYSTVQKALSTTCQVLSRTSDVYTVTFPAAQGVDFTVTSPVFTPEIAFMDAVGRMEMWAPPGSYGSVSLRVYAPAGAYQVATGVFGIYPNASYQLRSSPADNSAVCITALVIPDVTIQGEARSTQCAEPNVFHVRIPFGGRIRATLTSSAFNPHLVVDSRSGGDLTEAIGTGPGSTVQVVKTGLFNPLYRIYVWTQPGVTGAYTLTVERL
jgi:hypothetical protein